MATGRTGSAERFRPGRRMKSGGEASVYGFPDHRSHAKDPHQTHRRPRTRPLKGSGRSRGTLKVAVGEGDASGTRPTL